MENKGHEIYVAKGGFHILSTRINVSVYIESDTMGEFWNDPEDNITAMANKILNDTLLLPRLFNLDPRYMGNFGVERDDYYPDCSLDDDYLQPWRDCVLLYGSYHTVNYHGKDYEAAVVVCRDMFDDEKQKE